MRRSPWRSAQRPLPSMMTAMCAGNAPPRSGRTMFSLAMVLEPARDHLIALGTDGEHQDRRADLFLEPMDVGARVLGQVVEAPHARDVLAPAGMARVDRLDRVEAGLGRRPIAHLARLATGDAIAMCGLDL